MPPKLKISASSTSRRLAPPVRLWTVPVHNLIGDRGPVQPRTEQNQPVPRRIVERPVTLRLDICATRIDQSSGEQQRQRNVREIICIGLALVENCPPTATRGKLAVCIMFRCARRYPDGRSRASCSARHASPSEVRVNVVPGGLRRLAASPLSSSQRTRLARINGPMTLAFCAAVARRVPARRSAMKVNCSCVRSTASGVAQPECSTGLITVLLCSAPCSPRWCRWLSPPAACLSPLPR